MISKKLYYFLSFTWGLPLTLVGCIVALVLLCLGYRPEKFCYCWHFKVGKNWGGLELGIIFITDDTPTLRTKCHEFGHGLQNCYWGFLMPFVICIPSAVRYWWREFVVLTGTPASLLPSYDSIWFEGDATRRGTEAYQFLNGRKIMEGYINEFKKVFSLGKIDPNETLIMRYNLDKIGLDEIQGVYDYIADKFSHNKIIAIPDDITLTKFDKEELIDIYDYLSNLIEEL